MVLLPGSPFSGICVSSSYSQLSHRISRRCAALGAALTIFLITASQAFAQQPLQVLHNHVRPEVSGHQAALVRALPVDRQLRASIVLPLRNQDELTALLGRLYDPTSPDYRHFLSVAEFTARFAPSAQDYQTVVAFAQASGFTVTNSPANRLVVPISGTVDQINQAFHVAMNVYQHPTENRTFFSPDREPSLNLSVQVAHISGLNDFSLPHPMLTQPQAGQPIANVTGSGPGGSYLASDMRAAYYGGTTLTGNGQAVGLVEFDGYNLSDVNETFSNAGQTYSVPINSVLLDGATGVGTGGGEGEAVLDIVQAIGMAPGLSQVRVYIGTGTDDANVLNSIATENIAKQIGCSWSWTPDDPVTDDVFFKEFAAQGQSFFTASGDEGAFDKAISPYVYPQEDDYVTAVGGTHLTTNGAGGSWSSETAWNSEGYGSGGGISPDNLSIPSWQNGVANSSNAGSTVLRNVPDVAMEGDFDNYVCSLGVCSGNYAGTSFAAPRWAGFMALVNQQAVEAGNAPQGGIGFINPSIYQIGSGSNYSAEFHDVTAGNNDTENQPTWYNAVTGYDLVTGWGSANGQALIDQLAGPQVPGFWIQSSSSTVSVNQGTSSSTTITVSDAGGFTGNVTLAITSTLPSGVTAVWGTNPTSGTSVLTLTASSSAAASNTTLTITGTSGTLTATTNITVAVHAPTFVLSASPSSVSVNQGGTTTSTITVTPEYGFTGSATLSVSGLPSGVTASWGTNPTSGTSVLTLTASSTATPGTSILTLTGTSGSLTVTASMSLSVHGPSFTLSSSSSASVGQGSSTTSYVYVYPQYGFTGNVNLSVSGLPAGVTATFAPNPTAVTSSEASSTLTITASSSAVVGQYPLTITGTSGSLTATTTLALGVYAPSFTLSSSGSASVGQGSSVTSYVYVYPQYGFAGNVTLSVAGLPTGVTALWNPNPTTGNSQLTLAASSSAPTGQYTLTITGTSGTLSASTTLTLGVYTPTFTLYGPGTLSMGQGTSTSYYISVNSQYGFNGSVNLSASGLPSGVTASFTPNPTTPGSSLMKLTASSSATVGQYTVTITGTSGTQTASTTFTLGVYVPTFTLSAGSVTMGQGTTGSTYVSVSQLYGFTGSVNLSVSGLPTGITASLSPNPTTGSSTLTLTASSTAALGQYTLTITGTSGSQTATTTMTLGIYMPTFTLYGSTSVNVGQGNSATSYVYISPQYGFTGSVNLAVSGLPSGVTASFAPNPTTGSSMLTLTASSTAALGQYTLTVTGTSGSQTAAMTLTLGVYAPTFTLSAGSLNIGQGASGTAYVYVYGQYGFNSPVNLSVSGLPTGVTGTFSLNPATSSSTLTLTASSSAALGQYTVTITGTSGTQTAATTLTLGVYPQSFTIYDTYSTLTMNQGAINTSYVYITPQYGFSSGVTFTASGLPSGVTASFSPNPATSSSTLTLTASSAAAPGAATVTITGTSGTLTASTTVSLIVNASTFSLVAAPAEISLLPGNTAKSSTTVVPQYGFTGSVGLAISGLPPGVTGSFSPTTTSGSSTLTLTASSSAAVGSETATITGTSGGLTITVPFPVTVRNAPASTSTTLAISAGGSPVTTISSSTAVTLTAAVSVGSTPLTKGTVNFCDASATYCDQIHLVGTAQLTSSGTATIKFVPGMGTHSYKAVFQGTNTNGSSSSAASSLSVSASTATTTTLAENGSPGNYLLTATVVGQGPLAPSGTVSFLDTSNSNAVLGSAALALSQTSLSFTNPQSPAISGQPLAVAVADFNGDGKADLAVPSSSSSVTILFGNGDGSFTAGTQNIPTGSTPSAIVAADFNGDGKVDLAVANTNSNSVTILLGNGDGTFTPSTLSPQTGSYPKAIAVGDFNGDGILDLAVANESSSSVTILLGNGDGTFTATAASPQTGSYPQSIAVGDFNGDGIPDLAVANSSSSTVTILLGNGDGTFSSGATLTTGTYPLSVVVGDFNKDGIQDLAVANEDSYTVTILLGKGDGTFTATSTSPRTGSYPYGLAVVDLNHDGTPDLAVTNYYGPSVTTLLGNGDGTFTTGITPSTGTEPGPIAAGDFNGDGLPDLAAVSYGTDTVTVLTTQLTQTAKASAGSISPVGTGQHAVDASYPGDNNYKSSASATTQLTAELVTPGLTLSSATSTTTTQTETVNVTVSGGSGNPTPTGSVVLTSGKYTSAATTLSNGGAAIVIPAGALAVGTDSLTVAYTPDSSSSTVYTGGSSAVSVAVTQGTPNLQLSAVASINTTQALAVSVTVAGQSGDPTPTGSVALASGGYTSPAVSLSGGSANINVPAGTLALGTDALTVTYTPDASGSSTYASFSSSLSVTVTKATPVVLLSGLSGITTVQPTTITVTVSGVTGAPTATGSVKVSSGAYSSTATTLSSGSTTITIPAGSLAPGTDTLSAAYTPDTPGSLTYAAASGSGSIVVTTVKPGVTVTPSSGTINPSQPLSVNVALSGGSGAPVPTGSVTLTSGSYTSATTTLSAGGATLIIPAGSLALGADTLTIAYTPDTSGSATYASATGSASITVAKVTPSATVSPSASSILTIQPLPVTIAVTGGSGNPTPTGSVTLTSGSYTSVAAALNSGSVVITVPAGSLAAGTDSLSATYTPDANSTAYSAVTQTASVTVVPLGTTVATVTATPSPTIVTDQQSIAVAVSVSGASGQPTATGTITLSSGSYNAQQALTNGAASFTIAAGSLGAGADSLTAAYSGDATYAAASTKASVTVAPVVETASTPASVPPGTAGTATLTLTAGSTYSGTMNLNCTLGTSPSGAQYLPACSLNPNSVKLANGSTGTATITMSTTAPSTSAIVPQARPGLRNLGYGSVLACVILFGLPLRGRRRLPILVLLCVVAAGAIGCGSSGNGSTHSSTPGTTAGTYTFTVTGADSANSSITVSTTVTLTVQ